jgi:hypothetical protein
MEMSDFMLQPVYTQQRHLHPLYRRHCGPRSQSGPFWGKIFLISNGRYSDCLSITYVTNKSKILKLHHKYYVKREKKQKRKKRKNTLKVNIKGPMIRSSHKNSNREETKSVFHHFCPGLPVSLTFCPI